MYCPRPAHRLPSAVPEPVRNADDALSLLTLAISQPLRCETLAFLLDGGGRGGTLLVVTGTDRPEQLLDVVEHLAAAGGPGGVFTALVVASVRPHGGIEPGDVDRWFDASEIAARHGVQLVEWYVRGPSGFACPRDLVGEPERWPR